MKYWAAHFEDAVKNLSGLNGSKKDGKMWRHLTMFIGFFDHKGIASCEFI